MSLPRSSARVGVDRTAADAGTFSDGGVVAPSHCQAPPSDPYARTSRRSLNALRLVHLSVTRTTRPLSSGAVLTEPSGRVTPH